VGLPRLWARNTLRYVPHFPAIQAVQPGLGLNLQLVQLAQHRVLPENPAQLVEFRAGYVKTLSF
jgi:hypothetical protein